MSESVSADVSDDHEDIRRIQIGKTEIIVVGTAHISKVSADLVRTVVENESPDVICIELDERRYHSLCHQTKWEDLDILDLIRKQQISTLIVQVTLTSFQRRLGNQTGVAPGAEMLAAITLARSKNIPVELCDRDVRITLRRMWRSTPSTSKLMLLSSLFLSLFDKTAIDEQKLLEIRNQDVLSGLINEIGDEFPVLKTVLIDERDKYMATKIKAAGGQRIVAVVGAGHVNGLVSHIKDANKIDIEELEVIPPSSQLWKIAGWGIPAIIIGSLIWIAIDKGGAVARDNFYYWFLANGIPSALGASLALAHPLTILAAFLAAPFTSLTPVIGAGYVTAFIQTWLRPPRVREFQTVADDISRTSCWFTNRLLKIFLAFLLPGFGSMIGTWIGGIEIVRNVFN